MKISKLALTIHTAAAIASGRLVSFANTTCGADVPVLGVAAFDAESDADLTVDVMGVFFLPAGAAIAIGALVASDANGRPVSTTNADVAFGRALTAAANPGDTVKILVR